MLTLSHLFVHTPPTAAFDAVQAQERNIGYGYLATPTAGFAKPRGRGCITFDETRRLARTTPARLPIAAEGVRLSDLAAHAVDGLARLAGPQAVGRTTEIVVAQATLNEQIVESVAGRVQHLLGLRSAMPMGLAQCGTLGLYAALALAEGLLGGDDQMAFVAADKWLYPFFRVHGDTVAYGDASASLLIRRSAPATGIRVLGHVLVMGEALDDPWTLAPDALARRLDDPAREAATQALALAGLPASRLDRFVPACFAPAFARRLCAALDVDPARVPAPGREAHLSSSETIFALAEAQAALAPGERALALFCDVALAGMSGALVAELTGPPRLP